MQTKLFLKLNLDNKTRLYFRGKLNAFLLQFYDYDIFNARNSLYTESGFLTIGMIFLKLFEIH